ncbi:MAG TPA: type VI secretion system accessory protein TagJ [Pyrinomonadaceae bacterium]|nr:type VI secretion system accessory protein TagJ [Pyrinomonadaceae bacterium]
MNDAKLQLDSGNLTGAVENALALVKSNPTDVAARIFLFELSCFSGDWERAEKQLEVVGHQDAAAMIGSKIYQQNFKAERDRISFFENGTRPESAMKVPEYVEDLIKANELIRLGKTGEARVMLDQVETNRPAFKCSINGEGFSDFRDYNDATMCVIEAIIKDSYVWLPFEQIESIEFFERKSLRDIYWPQAKFELTNGTSGEMFAPSLYVQTWKADDDLVRLGRSVDWRDLGNDIYSGEGARLFTMDGRDRSLLDITSIRFDHSV